MASGSCKRNALPPGWFFIPLGAAVLLLSAASVSVRCTSVDHMPSTEEDVTDYAELKSKTQQAKDELKCKTQQAADEASKSKTEQAVDTASHAGKEAKYSTESWAEWAKEKISEGLGFKQDEPSDGTRTSSATDTKNTASG